MGERLQQALGSITKEPISLAARRDVTCRGSYTEPLLALNTHTLECSAHHHHQLGGQVFTPIRPWKRLSDISKRQRCFTSRVILRVQDGANVQLRKMGHESYVNLDTGIECGQACMHPLCRYQSVWRAGTRWHARTLIPHTHSKRCDSLKP